jgi:hypothetical protein
VGLAAPGKNLRVAARLVSLLFAAALASIASAAPGVGGWRSGGPFGGTASAFEIDPARPAILYAGTYGAGVFKSTDRGATWRRSSRGLPPDTLVLILELAPSQPSTLYLQAYSPGGSTSAPTRERHGRRYQARLAPSTTSTSTRRVRRPCTSPRMRASTAGAERRGRG